MSTIIAFKIVTVIAVILGMVSAADPIASTLAIVTVILGLAFAVLHLSEQRGSTR